jgi:copper chaperone CopZ
LRKLSSIGEGGEGVAVAEEQPQETVSVPVSPSDMLTMFFQADGTLNEAAIPNVTRALQDIDGVSNLKVQVSEGVAVVELLKQTTVQATGVASNLVETIQGAGFKLQTLNLSFEDDDEVLV